MNVGGSQQLRMFRRARRDGVSVERAADLAGFTLLEAKLWVEADARLPPPPEAFELLPERAPSSTTNDQEETQDMASAAEKQTDNGGEYKKPDAAGAFQIYDREIKAKKAVIAEKTGDLSEPYSRIKDTCNYPRKILDLIIFIEDQEDAKRDHLLLALSAGLKVRKLFMPSDLVTRAEGEDGGDIVPTSSRPRPQLVTLPVHEGDNSDLVDAALDPDEDGEEIGKSADEGFANEGTGSAAVAAMNKASRPRKGVPLN